MNKSKIKICKFPGCHKEVENEKSLFCGEHGREIKNNAKTAGKLLGVAATVAVSVGGLIFNKSKE